MALQKHMKVSLQRALLAFKLEDIFQYVLPEFRLVSAEEISNVFSQHRLQLSRKKVVSVFMKLLLSKDLASEDFQRSIVLLQIQAVALRPECRLWTALRLLGEPNISGYTPAVVENLVFRSLRRNGVESIVRVVNRSSAFWINITMKKITQRKGVVLEQPIFCVFYVDHPFIFISKTNSATIKTSVSDAFGFASYSQCKLTDRDPRSMLEILTTKENRLEVVQAVKLSNKPLEMDRGLDFSQYRNRSEYMSHVFPADAPKLSDYSVECKEAPWPENSKFPAMADRPYSVCLQLRTRDTIGMFRAMAEEGILNVPLPCYVRRALKCARNKIKVRANSNNSILDHTV